MPKSPKKIKNQYTFDFFSLHKEEKEIESGACLFTYHCPMEIHTSPVTPVSANPLLYTRQRFGAACFALLVWENTMGGKKRWCFPFLALILSACRVIIQIK